jgi:stage V sporulation protein D (sporulation-specific penicillin-binding protein)
VRDILEYVVAEGSGRNAYMAGYRIGGKTGTSEKRDELDNDDVICSFMGFAPVDDPQVIVLLAYDSPKRATSGSNYTAAGTYISGGNITAPMAGQLIASILDYLGVEKQYTNDELAATDVTMPNVKSYELTVAKGLLADQNIHCRTVGTGNRVTGQIPAAGVSIPGGSTVILYLGEDVPTDQVEVPDLTGLTPTEAKNTLEDLGLFLRATGVADYTDATIRAASQSLSAGTMVAMGTVLEVRFVSTVIDYGDQ